MAEKQYFLVVLITDTDEKRVIPSRWCIEFKNTKEINYNNKYQFFFSDNENAEVDKTKLHDGYILNYSSWYLMKKKMDTSL